FVKYEDHKLSKVGQQRHSEADEEGPIRPLSCYSLAGHFLDGKCQRKSSLNESADGPSNIPSTISTPNKFSWPQRRTLSRLCSQIRYGILSVYRRLFTVVFLANTVAMTVLLVLCFRRISDGGDEMKRDGLLP